MTTESEDFTAWLAAQMQPQPDTAPAAVAPPDTQPPSPEALFSAYMRAALASDNTQTATPTTNESETH